MRSLNERASVPSESISAATPPAPRWLARQLDFSLAGACTKAIVGVAWILAVWLAISANVGCAALMQKTPPRDQIARMQTARGLMIDAAEVAFTAGQLDDKQRRDVVRTNLAQMGAAVDAANALRTTPGQRLAEDSEPVERFDAAHARVKAALLEAEQSAVRENAGRERRRDEFLDQMLGAPSVPTPTKAGQP